MKLYLSSIAIPTPDDLATLLEKPLSEVAVALIPNAKDYLVERARNFVIGERVRLFESLGMKVDVVDLRDFNDALNLRAELAPYNLIWAMGGNTFVLRNAMKRSGFDFIIEDLLLTGTVYGGDSAGALVAGSSIGGINLESADTPQFAEEVIYKGLNLVPYIIVPHSDNPEFAEVMKAVGQRPDRGKKLIELKDSGAVIFDGDAHRVISI